MQITRERERWMMRRRGKVGVNGGGVFVRESKRQRLRWRDTNKPCIRHRRTEPRQHDEEVRINYANFTIKAPLVAGVAGAELLALLINATASDAATWRDEHELAQSCLM